MKRATSRRQSCTVVIMSTVEYVFHEGDHALLRLGTTDVEVEVIEERGVIGVHGSRLVRVRMPVTSAA